MDAGLAVLVVERGTTVIAVFAGPEEAFGTLDLDEVLATFGAGCCLAGAGALMGLEVGLAVFIGEGRLARWIADAAPEEAVLAFAALHGLMAIRAEDGVLGRRDMDGFSGLEEVADLSFLLLLEVVEGKRATEDFFKLLFPDGCGIWIRDRLGQELDCHAGFVGRHKVLLVDCEEATFLQSVDDAGTRGFCADATALLELGFEGRVLDVLVDFLHGLEKGGRVEAFRRLGLFLEDLAAGEGDGVAFLAVWQDGTPLFLIVLGLVLGVDVLPAGHEDSLAIGDEVLTIGLDRDARGLVGVDREELGKVGLGDHVVEVLLNLTEGIEIGVHGRRDDCVMRGDLLVVPSTATDAGIGFGDECGEAVFLDAGEVLEDGRCVGELVRRQVVAVGTRIGREFLLVELLHGIEDLLRRVAVTAAGLNLECGERIREMLAFLLLLLLDLLDLGRSALDAGNEAFGDAGVEESPLFIETVHILGHLPGRLDVAVGVVEEHLGDVVGRRLEVRDLAFTAHDKRHRRRLDTTHGEDAVVAGVTCLDRVEAREVHADEPVGTGTAKRCVAHADEVLVRAQILQGFLDALVVEGIEEDALDRFLVADVLEYLVDEELAFAVRVAGVDDLIALADEVLDDFILVAGIFLDLELPVFRDDRQVFEMPVGILLVVLVRSELLEDVAEAPRDDIAVGALDAAVLLMLAA